MLADVTPRQAPNQSDTFEDVIVKMNQIRFICIQSKPLGDDADNETDLALSSITLIGACYQCRKECYKIHKCP